MEIVHEERERLVTGDLTQLPEVVSKLRLVDRPIINVDDVDTFLRRHGNECRPVAHVELHLICTQVRVSRRPLTLLDGPLRKEDLV